MGAQTHRGSRVTNANSVAKNPMTNQRSSVRPTGAEVVAAHVADGEQLETIDAVARSAGLSVGPDTRLRWVNELGLPAVKVGHGWRTTRSAFHAWLKTQGRKDA